MMYFTWLEIISMQGYIEEKLLSWLEQDLSYIKEGSLVFVAMHIPSRLEVGQIPFEYSNANIAGRVSNAAFLYENIKALPCSSLDRTYTLQ
ncbi:hypothetical protein NXX38_16940 [Bacteroides sp. BFG-637]|uniref:hypothetical protein n=1 Tax=Bacteroides sp. BFG-637 TaxID=2972764 RepID=UPI0021653719|nr:hypothetical protein [Bacteroides sp. BFG-637]MCS3313487.1 hypothetical protein [Bacteroides sp. BFG-637]